MGRAGRVCVFAKPPVAGAVKTRLAPRLGADGAARLAAAMFADTWAVVGARPDVERVLATTGPGLSVGDAPMWLQGDGDLGARLERVLRRALADAPFAIALGADSPGLPPTAIDAAIAALATHDAVLGPTDDGGYYLIGLRACPDGLFAGLPWSSPDTRRATLARLAERGLTTAVIGGYFDVDGPDDLDRLTALLTGDPSRAPRTAAALGVG